MDSFRPRHFMLLPTMTCQASCRYCFAHKNGDRMSRETAVKAMEFISRIVKEDAEFQVVFHGGEPLLAGEDFFEWILPEMMERFGWQVKFGIQSNLWAITDKLAELFRRYRVSVGTSLDGPRDMCDEQRGEGYYARTKAGEALLEEHGLYAAEICTFTAQSAGRAAEVYFRSDRPYSVHGCVPALNMAAAGDNVDAEQMTRILMDTYEAYRADPAHGRVTTIDAMARGVLQEKGKICTFFDCVGTFAAIAPNGDVYGCQRFCGLEKYCFGNVKDNLTEEQILTGSAWKRLNEVRNGMKKACGACKKWNICMGGCPYNAITAGTEKDPYCKAYAAMFDRLRLDMALEMGETMLGKAGPAPVLSMAGERLHPWDAAQNRAKRCMAADKGKEKAAWSEKLACAWPEDNLNKLYLHVTFSCPLHCGHCYARGGERAVPPLSPERFAGIVSEAVDRRFRAVVITGGEPLIWEGFDRLCEYLRHLNRKGTRLILRSSFGMEIPSGRMGRMAELFDEIVISVDGDKETHDARRGKGKYDLTVRNLETAAAAKAKLSLAAAMDKEDCEGTPGESVRKLAKRLGIEKVRFRPVLPLGRAEGSGTAGWQLCGAETASDLPLYPRYTCGLGQNLYVEPDGKAYPCYAWCGEGKKLGNLGQESLETMLRRGTLYEYSRHTVDTNEKCRECEVRYLCGGICKAWVRNKDNVDSGDFDCKSRKQYYQQLAVLVKGEK